MLTSIGTLGLSTLPKLVKASGVKPLFGIANFNAQPVAAKPTIPTTLPVNTKPVTVYVKPEIKVMTTSEVISASSLVTKKPVVKKSAVKKPAKPVAKPSKKVEVKKVVVKAVAKKASKPAKKSSKKTVKKSNKKK